MPDNPIPGEDLEALAAGLTKAQRPVLTQAHEMLFGNGRITSARMDPRVRMSLQSKGLTTPYDWRRDTLTPLGLALRSHLISRETPNAS